MLQTVTDTLSLGVLCYRLLLTHVTGCVISQTVTDTLSPCYRVCCVTGRPTDHGAV